VCAIKGLLEGYEDKDESPCKYEASNMILRNSMHRETWQHVKMNPDLNENERNQLQILLKDYQDIFLMY
jgi:hypothetical protein